MTLLKRSAVKAPVVRKETVAVPSLKGDVVVRGLLLSERLELSAVNKQLSAVQEGEDVETALARAGAQIVSRTLEKVVLLADGKPLFTAREWDEHGATNSDDVLALFKVARRLGGFEAGAIAKN